MKEFYNSNEMFKQAQAISNSDNYKSLLNNQIDVIRQACRNIFSRLCIDGTFHCYLYMDENEAQGLCYNLRVICTSIDEKEGIILFHCDNYPLLFEFDKLDTDILISMINQL